VIAIAQGLPLDSAYAAVKFATDGEKLSQVTTDFSVFSNNVTTSPYEGGSTNTQQGIVKCAELIRGEAFPIIVLVTDGTPTACNPEGSTYFDTKRPFDCNGNDQNAFEAAVEAADLARVYGNGIDIIPVIINSVDTNVAQLEALARCRDFDGICTDYSGLSVDSFDISVTNIVSEVLQAAACRDPTPDPSSAPSEVPGR